MTAPDHFEVIGSRGFYRPVARAEIIDPQKIGAMMAQNRGANGDVFTSEMDALAWLDTRI
jgi:hypothetical protein